MQVAKGNKSGVEIRFIMCAIYLLLGMALIAMCFNLMQVSEIAASPEEKCDRKAHH